MLLRQVEGRLGLGSGKRIFRRLPLLHLALIALLASAASAHAITHASILVDARTGQILESDNADALAHPASLTKLMTLYITFQRLSEGKINLDSRFYVSRFAAAQQPTKLDLRPGSTVAVRDCILGITGHSANDAAMVLAENIGGSEAAFVALMNQQARALGMTRTIFYNANGLPNNRQWTTARDMSKLALALIRTYPQYYHFFNTPSFEFNGRTYIGFDHILNEYRGADGMKTGYIRTSGYNIVTSAIRDNRRLVGVVLGGRTAHARDLQMMALLDRGFAGSAEPLVASAAAPAPLPASQATPVARPVVVAERARTTIPARRVRPATYHSEIAWAHNWTIEIGNRFRSRYSVYRTLRGARRTAPTPLRRGHAQVIRLRPADYRARFAGLSYPMARRACSALTARRFSCRILGQHSRPGANFANALATAIPAGE